jgi:hypothetical protein
MYSWKRWKYSPVRMCYRSRFSGMMVRSLSRDMSAMCSKCCLRSQQRHTDLGICYVEGRTRVPYSPLLLNLLEYLPRRQLSFVSGFRHDPDWFLPSALAGAACMVMFVAAVCMIVFVAAPSCAGAVAAGRYHAAKPQSKPQASPC